MNRSRQELFENLSIPKAFFALTIPTVLGKIVMLLYNMADTWFIAATDNARLVAGVALCGPVFMLMITIGDIFGVGGSSVISRLFGRGETEKAGSVSSFCLYGALTSGVLTGVILLLFQNPILRLLGADGETFPYAVEYYRYIAIGAPLIVTSIVPLNLLRSEGMAKASMFGSVLDSVVNIILDPIFIFKLNMGAAADIASKISMIAAMMIVSFAFGALPLVGYAYGKGDKPKLMAIIKFFYIFQFCMSTAVALVLGGFSRFFVAAFMDEPAILAAGTALLRWQLVGMPFISVVLVSTCIFQASGKSGPALILSLSRQGVMYLAVIVIANALFGYNGVIAAQPADLLSAVLAIFLLAKSLGKEWHTS